MNIEKLRADLELDEGVKHEIYLDHLGLPTFGIGHLVTESDPEYGQEVGTEVSEDRVAEAFEQDIETTLSECTVLYPDFDDLPEEELSEEEAPEEESVEEKSLQERGPSTENLIQQRYHFLDNLNSSFQKLDNDLQSISFLQTEMSNARSEILEKKERALEKKIILDENRRDLEEEREQLESDLEISVKEEEALTLEYAQLINKVEGSIVLGDDIDRILFSSLVTVDD